ncbi:MAG: GNAT family N-acetyltransferase [Ruminococcaceae bacterium]|nr:GNAT family N-acetyltransferase [Oscillospiraceae bacterium]
MEFNAKFFSELTTHELYEIIKSRLEIFTVEQKVAYQDLDDIDYDALHCFFCEGEKILAYLRAFRIDDDTIKLGRVLTLSHGDGLGRKLMEKSIDAVKDAFDFKTIHISAQKYAIGFYEKFGFVVTTDVYLEDSIEHVGMDFSL